jgi:type VI secretion system secreted protein Hcp
LAIYMKYEGIDGESMVRGKKGWMELSSYAWGLSRATAAAKGQVRGDAQFSVNEITVTRVADSLSALLVQEAALGKFDRKVEIAFIRTGANRKPSVFLSVTLREAGLSSYNMTSGGDTPTESMSLSFNMIEVQSHKTEDDLTSVPNTAALDISAGTRG